MTKLPPTETDSVALIILNLTNRFYLNKNESSCQVGTAPEYAGSARIREYIIVVVNKNVYVYSLRCHQDAGIYEL